MDTQEQRDQRLKRLKADMSDEQIKECLRIAIDNRRFEIDLLWRRTLVFAGFVAALFIAVTQARAAHPHLTIVLSAAGIVLSFVWSLVNRGSKSWQESWQLKAKAYSTKVVVFAGRARPEGSLCPVTACDVFGVQTSHGG